MASFSNMVITNAGLKLLQDLILEGGTPLTFSGVGVGDGMLENANIAAQATLINEIHRLPIEKIERQEVGNIRIFVRLSTDMITSDFYHRELGVFTRHGEQEILFAYGNAGNDYDYIPAVGSNAVITKIIVTEFNVGNMTSIFIPLNSSDFVTHEAMNSQVEEVIVRETDKVLAAIPTVDEAGNMTLTGRLTTNGATVNGQLNANGGINIPVPPATDTDGVNRLYAAGLSAVVETMRVPLYLSKSKSTLTQGAFTEPGPGLVMSAPVAAKSRQMLSIGLDYTMHAASNYSQGLGWVLPLRSTVYGQLKVSVSYGHGVYTAASSDDMDAYEIYPTDASKLAYGAAMDIYLNQTNIGGNLAAVRTRIIYYDLAVKMMMVRTVTAHVDIHNTGLISATSAIVYQQHSDTSGGNPTSDYGSIWLIRNGLASKNIVKIADVPGIHCFSGAKLNSPVLINGKAEDIYANVINVGAPVMQLACGNGRNPAYYGFQALETNAVISMTTAPYEPPTNV